MNDIARINLQNTPDSKDIRRTEVQFTRGENTLVGILFTPQNAQAPLPAVVVTGAWTTVKEQMAGTYARALAERGFAALVFDFTGWGASAGDDRFLEDPAMKTADIHAAFDYLATRRDVDNGRIFGLGVCASSGYMASAVADHDKASKLALVAPWLHDPEMAQGIYGGAEAAQGLIAQGRAAAQTDTATILEAASTENEGSLMYQAPYYTEADRGLIEAYDNKYNVASWEPWLTYDAQLSADRLSVPTLIVCSAAAALPAGAKAYAARMSAPLQELWLDDVNQFDFYDRADVVNHVVGALSRHFAS